MAFNKELGYVGGIVPPDAGLRKRLKRFLDTCWLVDARIEGEMNDIFAKLLRNLTPLYQFLE